MDRNNEIAKLLEDYLDYCKRELSESKSWMCFEVVYNYYGKKGDKNKAFLVWTEMSDAERAKAQMHISFYSIVTDRDDRMNFEDYLANGEWKKDINPLREAFEVLY